MTQDLPKSRKRKLLVVDDHELMLGGIIDTLRRKYPEAEILTAQTFQSALEQLERFQLDLVIVDLSIPEASENTAKIETGIKLLQIVMKQYPNLNLVVLSTYLKALVRIKDEIDEHNGGFTLVDKGFSGQVMLTRVDWALQGLTHTKDLNMLKGEVKPEWLELLTLAFHEELQDKAIAGRMHKSERTVVHYWTKIRDVLGVYPEGGKNLRIQTEMRAREEGFID
ncbi:MAG: response regulator transcription factor [Moorea sp. SIO3E2]|uniref:Two-component response regulator, CheY subfamily n=2 Tax=Coleofasciculaceae TaxID=1892251 RepID=F4Y1D1_9CYAN|nr:two-component response regulator, CheY subfamily [Moorena producens 3L]NEP34226.1 response regulator transcription factor [Moorena sp. SIO3B2]NEP67015.1 response regulator transcription factor [Moorena sp. SIO3A5]NEQ09717.1 response regulator transcription factor [Moorena sp. SIO4E2]NEQ12638.1 response regulator transcription factor [Moorena sp. SIO3E2]NES45461.1 response regulator transcription factor [Moorena sp. SIO2C4]